MNPLETAIYDTSLARWATTGILALALALGLYVLRRTAAARLQPSAQATKTWMDDIAVQLLHSTHFLFLLAAATYVFAFLLALPSRALQALHVALIFALLGQAALWGNSLLDLWVSRYTYAPPQEDYRRASTIALLGHLGRFLLWALIILLALDNLGIDTTALIAGLGIGGIAVALAAQNILGDLFASLSIMLDKPFMIGDYITVDGYAGRVEYIGVKTTRVRSLSGEEIVFSNTDLLKSRIRNFKHLFERRVCQTLSVAYENDDETLNDIPALLKNSVEKQQHARFDRAHFKQYRDFAIDFELVYFVDTADYHLYMDVQQAVNLAIFRCFHQRGIAFAHQATAATQRLNRQTAS